MKQITATRTKFFWWDPPTYFPILLRGSTKFSQIARGANRLVQQAKNGRKNLQSVDGPHLKKPICAFSQVLGNTLDLFGEPRNLEDTLNIFEARAPLVVTYTLCWSKDGAKALTVWSRISDWLLGTAWWLLGLNLDMIKRVGWSSYRWGRCAYQVYRVDQWTPTGSVKWWWGDRSQTMILCNVYIKTNLTFKLLLNDALEFSQKLRWSCCVVPPLRRFSCELTCNAPPVDAWCVLIGRPLLLMILNPFERVTVSLQHASMLHRYYFCPSRVLRCK